MSAPSCETGAVQAGAEERARVSLYSGEVLVAPRPCLVSTILGSCVAVCAWDPVARLGGMTHFLLPFWAGRGVSSARFGNVAVEQLLRDLRLLGAASGRLRALVFGGACVLAAFRRGGRHLGTQNAETALQLLAEHGVPVIGQDTGGDRGRKVFFATDTGEHRVERL